MAGFEECKVPHWDTDTDTDTDIFHLDSIYKSEERKKECRISENIKKTKYVQAIKSDTNVDENRKKQVSNQ